MKQEKVTCDWCHKDLTTTGNCVDYRLALVPERIPSVGPTSTLMLIEPDVKCAHHFCGLRCLAGWVERESSHSSVLKSRDSVVGLTGTLDGTCLTSQVLKQEG